MPATHHRDDGGALIASPTATAFGFRGRWSPPERLGAAATPIVSGPTGLATSELSMILDRPVRQ